MTIETSKAFYKTTVENRGRSPLYHRGKKITFEPNKVFIVEKGIVGVASRPIKPEARWIGRVVKPGGFFGFENFGTGEEYFEAEVITPDAEVTALTIVQTVKGQNEISFTDLQKSMEEAIERIDGERLRSRRRFLPQLLAHTLLELMIENDSGDLETDVWDKTIALIVGADPTTVSRALEGWHRREIINKMGMTSKRFGSRIVILNPPKLEDIANS